MQQDQSKTETLAAVRSSDGLGVNRVGDAILCLAWGETDRTDAFLAKTADDVKRFIVTEWIDDENHPTVKETMDELAAHDWNEEGRLEYQFEIGGVSFEDVVAVTPNRIKLCDRAKSEIRIMEPQNSEITQGQPGSLKRVVRRRRVCCKCGRQKASTKRRLVVDTSVPKQVWLKICSPCFAALPEE